MIFCSFQKRIIEILYNKFGTDNTFDSNEAIEALQEGSDYIKKQPIANIRYYLTQMRKWGVLIVVGQIKQQGRMLINQLNRGFIEKHIQLDYLLKEPRNQHKEQQKDLSGGVGVSPDIKFFIGELMFDTLQDAVEHCKKYIIKVKRAKIIWE